MADIESMSEDAEEGDDDTYVHNKTLDTESQEVEGNNLVVNALSILRAPRKSELARKRKLKVNQQINALATLGLRLQRPQFNWELPIREFPDEHFTDTATDSGSIFCETCREEISVKRSIYLKVAPYSNIKC